jgi:hypothetical protein
MLQAMARPTETPAIEPGTAAGNGPGAPKIDLVEPFLARISAKASRSAANAESRIGTAAGAPRGTAAAPVIDPLVARTSGEGSQSVADAAIAVNDGMRSAQIQNEQAGQLIDPLAHEFRVPAPPAPPAPEFTSDVGTLGPENSRGLSGKPIDPLARTDEEGVRPLPAIRTVGNTRESIVPKEQTTKQIDPHVARASSELIPAPPSLAQRDAAPISSNPPRPASDDPSRPAGGNSPRLAQQRTDAYLDGIGKTHAPGLGSTVPSGRPAASSPNSVTTTYIDPNCAETGPTFDFTMEALLWRMEHTRGQPMMVNPVLGRTVQTSDLNLGLQVGPRLMMDFLSDEDDTIHSFEIGYFGIYNWFDRLTEVAPAGTFLRLPDVLGDVGVTTDFSGASAMVARDQSRINSVELNVFFGRRDSSFHWALGPRFIRLEEQFNLNSFTADRFSFYSVDTLNDLWGLQWVGRWRGTRGCWEFTSICKVGIYDNQVRQSTLLTDNDRTVVLRSFSPSETVASLVVDGGFTAAYQFNGTWLARVGYNVFYMDNVARATDQLDFSNNATSGSRLFFRQDALAHGFNFGLEARW